MPILTASLTATTPGNSKPLKTRYIFNSYGRWTTREIVKSSVGDRQDGDNFGLLKIALFEIRKTPNVPSHVATKRISIPSSSSG